MRREYADFRVSSDGEVQGVGLLIASDPSSGRLVVLAPIQGGPADRAGIQPGDEVSGKPHLLLRATPCCTQARPPLHAESLSVSRACCRTLAERAGGLVHAACARQPERALLSVMVAMCMEPPLHCKPEQAAAGIALERRC
jgi:hypothetical protein